jgi:hypothetical protein
MSPEIKSPNAAYEKAVSAEVGWHANTEYCCSRPSSIPARHNVVFPIPAAPSSHKASGLAARAKKRPIRSSSDSRPTTSSSANVPPSTVDRVPPFHERTPGGSLQQLCG